MSDAAQNTSRLIAELWQRNQPLIQERLAQLDAAAAAARDGLLSISQREEAAGTAHKLSGSVGMFGFNSATDFARDLEVELLDPEPNPDRLASLSASLRAALYPGAVQQ